MRGEQNNILFPVRISWANNFSTFGRLVGPFGLMWHTATLRPN